MSTLLVPPRYRQRELMYPGRKPLRAVKRNIQHWFWPFSEGAGDTAYDLSINGDHCVITDPVWGIDPEQGRVLRFNGTSGFASTDNNAIGAPGQSFTLFVRLRSSDSFTGNHFALSNYVDADHSGFFAIGADNSAAGMFFWMRDTVGTTVAKTSAYAPAFDGAWHDYMAVRDDTKKEARFYIDGELVEVITGISSGAVKDADSFVGVMRHNGAVTRTLAGDVAFWWVCPYALSVHEGLDAHTDPYRDFQSRKRFAALTTQAANQVTALVNANAEALGGITRQTPANIEAQRAVSQTAASGAESLRSASRISQPSAESLACVESTAIANAESLGSAAVAVQSVVPMESLAAITRPITASAEGLMQIERIAAPGTESLQSIEQAATLSAEALRPVEQTMASGVESLARLSNQIDIRIESLRGVTATAPGHLECMARIAFVSPVPVESLQIISGQAALSIETLQAIAQAAQIPVEALLGDSANVIIDVVEKTARFQLRRDYAALFGDVVTKPIIFH